MNKAERRRYSFHLFGSITVDGFSFDRQSDWAFSVLSQLEQKHAPKN